MLDDRVDGRGAAHVQPATEPDVAAHQGHDLTTREHQVEHQANLHLGPGTNPLEGPPLTLALCKEPASSRKAEGASGGGLFSTGSQASASSQAALSSPDQQSIDDIKVQLSGDGTGGLGVGDLSTHGFSIHGGALFSAAPSVYAGAARKSAHPSSPRTVPLI